MLAVVGMGVPIIALATTDDPLLLLAAGATGLVATLLSIRRPRPSKHWWLAPEERPIWLNRPDGW